jgi:hypothetical protein
MRKRLAAVIAIAVIGAATAGCGSNDIDGTIPQEDADQLISDLDAIESASASNDCASAEARAQDFKEHVDALPATSGVALKEALRGAGDNLEQLVRDPCASGATGESGQEPSDSQSGTSPPEPTTTEPTTTTAPTTTTSPSRTQPPPPPSGGQGGDDGPPPSGGGSQGGGDQSGGSSGGTGGGTGGTGVGGGA